MSNTLKMLIQCLRESETYLQRVDIYIHKNIDKNKLINSSSPNIVVMQYIMK